MQCNGRCEARRRVVGGHWPAQQAPAPGDEALNGQLDPTDDVTEFRHVYLVALLPAGSALAMEKLPQAGIRWGRSTRTA